MSDTPESARTAAAMSDADEIQVMIEDCEQRSEKLSDWECGFIDSISDQLGRGHGLTDKQEQILTRIWEKVT